MRFGVDRGRAELRLETPRQNNDEPRRQRLEDRAPKRLDPRRAVEIDVEIEPAQELRHAAIREWQNRPVRRQHAITLRHPTAEDPHIEARIVGIDRRRFFARVRPLLRVGPRVPADDDAIANRSVGRPDRPLVEIDEMRPVLGRDLVLAHRPWLQRAPHIDPDRREDRCDPEHRPDVREHHAQVVLDDPLGIDLGMRHHKHDLARHDPQPPRRQILEQRRMVDQDETGRNRLVRIDHNHAPRLDMRRQLRVNRMRPAQQRALDHQQPAAKPGLVRRRNLTGERRRGPARKPRIGNEENVERRHRALADSCGTGATSCHSRAGNAEPGEPNWPHCATSLPEFCPAARTEPAILRPTMTVSFRPIPRCRSCS